MERLPGVPIQTIMLMRLVRAANQALTAYLDKVLRPLGFTEDTFHTLVLLFVNEPGTATPSALCELVGQTRANMTRILEALGSKGYVSRASDDADGRRQLIRITTQGKQLVRKALPRLAGPLSLSVAGLAGKEAQGLGELLRKLVLSLDVGERKLRASAL